MCDRLFLSGGQGERDTAVVVERKLPICFVAALILQSSSTGVRSGSEINARLAPGRFSFNQEID